MGVGGTFDVLAGYVRRAPRLLQAAGPGVVLAAADGAAQDVEALPGRRNSEYLWLAAGEILRRRVGSRRAPMSARRTTG